jgi:cell wall-associated NlpC family hydrolase
MSLFFELKFKQPFYLVGILSLLFFASCASHKKAMARKKMIDQVISSARSYTGTPYKYGGTTRSGLDCSGLLINSFRAVKIDLPRSSKDQSKVGKPVKLKEVEPGDLVFFATGKRKRRITHVGLVTERRSKKDIKFIHASSSLGVVEANIFADYYRKTFREARRVIK